MKLVNVCQVPEGFLLMHLWVARFQRPRAYEAHWLTERTTEADIADVQEPVYRIDCYHSQKKEKKRLMITD